MIFKWNGLVMALPREWRNTITRAAPENLSDDLNVRIVLDGKAVLLEDLKTKTMCNIFGKGIFKSPTAQESICRKLNTEITNWEEIYIFKRKITTYSYSRIYLYKILNNILHVNKSLSRMKVLDSPLCSLCNAEDETIIHLFSKCSVTINLWRNIQSWANSIGLSLPDLDSKNSFLGSIGLAKPIIIENFLLLIFKKFICQKKTTSKC